MWSNKVFCGRKHKCGLNLQGVCDSEGIFLDVDLSHPASTSDFLAWSMCELKRNMDGPGFLAPGLRLFGDLAYSNRSHMATPHKNVRSGSKDDYNYYHSQVRIRIECSFGMLVNCWGILRKAISATISLEKSGSLVVALCMLHNFCITERLEQAGVSEEYPEPLAQDRFNIQSEGGVTLEPSTRDQELNSSSAEQLLHGGHHFDDVPANLCRQFNRTTNGAAEGEHATRDNA